MMVEQNWARERGYGVGDRVPRRHADRAGELRVVGIFRFSSGLSFGGSGFAAMPLPRGARVDRSCRRGWIQITIAADDRGDVAAAAAARRARRSDPASTCRRPAGLGDEIESSCRASTSSSTSSPGVALFVGGFLILNSFNMTVLQRMREIGMLRTLGASRADGRARRC